MSRASCPSIRSSRSFSSPAALFVKVMARMDQGTAGSRQHRLSARALPDSSGCCAYRSRNSRSSRVTRVGTSLLSEPRPYFMRFAMRWISTVVFPLPAPASRSSGPSVASTPERCCGFSRENSCAMTALRALQNLSSSSRSNSAALLSFLRSICLILPFSPRPVNDFHQARPPPGSTGGARTGFIPPPRGAEAAGKGNARNPRGATKKRPEASLLSNEFSYSLRPAAPAARAPPPGRLPPRQAPPLLRPGLRPPARRPRPFRRSSPSARQSGRCSPRCSPSRP